MSDATDSKPRPGPNTQDSHQEILRVLKRQDHRVYSIGMIEEAANLSRKTIAERLREVRGAPEDYDSIQFQEAGGMTVYWYEDPTKIVEDGGTHTFESILVSVTAFSAVIAFLGAAWQGINLLAVELGGANVDPVPGFPVAFTIALLATVPMLVSYYFLATNRARELGPRAELWVQRQDAKLRGRWS